MEREGKPPGKRGGAAKLDKATRAIEREGRKLLGGAGQISGIMG